MGWGLPRKGVEKFLPSKLVVLTSHKSKTDLLYNSFGTDGTNLKHASEVESQSPSWLLLLTYIR